MKYEVIARKFRPQLFEDVVGQNPIVQTLKNAIEMDRIGQAYLFCGPRGVGKTTTARLLAKALNCVNGPTATPCNACPSCSEIANGHATDVLEIDAASNTGVDSIRELRENARYLPLRDRFKIFIIDEVHMLSTSAFNALLKILEEPPEHIAFILATTERHKLPATILSRCQQFVFRTIPPAEILDHLRTIAEREHVQIGSGALEHIVKAAEGSMRDAQSLLDQVIAFGGQDIGDQDVRDLLGLVPAEMLDAAVQAMVTHESRALLDLVEALVQQGLNLHQFARELSSRMRDLLLVKVGLTEKILGSTEEREKIALEAEHFSQQDLIRLLDLLLRLENDLRWTSQPRFHLEMGCVKLVTICQLRDIEEVIRDLKTGREPGSSASQPKDPPTSPGRAAPPTGTHPPSGAAADKVQPPLSAPEPSPQSGPGPKRGVSPKPGRVDPKGVNRASAPATDAPTASQLAEQYLEHVQARSETTALYLDQAHAVHFGDQTVEIRLTEPSVRDTLETEAHRTHLERAAVELLGRPVSLSLIMTRAAGAAVQAGPKGQTGSTVSLRGSAENEPLVKHFLEVFRGQIAHVRETDTPKEGGQQ